MSESITVIVLIDSNEDNREFWQITPDISGRNGLVNLAYHGNVWGGDIGSDNDVLSGSYRGFDLREVREFLDALLTLPYVLCYTTITGGWITEIRDPQ